METKIKSDYGKINIYRRGSTYHYSISFRDKLIPKHLIRHRETLSGVPVIDLERECLRRVDIAYRRALKGITVKQYDLLPFIRNTYMPWMFQQAEKRRPIATKSKWSIRKAIHDERCINKYLIPYLNENNYSWATVTSRRFGIGLVDYLRNHISDRTIQIYLGSFNHIFRKAIDEGLIERLPEYPKLVDAIKVKGLRITSIARATDEMMDALLKAIKKQIELGTTDQQKRRAKLILQWLIILLDTGIRPFSKLPLVFNDFHETNQGIWFWRKEKGNEYKAVGTFRTKDAVATLKEMYREEGIITPNVLADENGNPETQLDTCLRGIIKACGWKDVFDEDGRKYTSYAIRKWHINKAINEHGEDPHKVAMRVGHRYETLIEYYLDPMNVPEERHDIAEELTELTESY